MEVEKTYWLAVGEGKYRYTTEVPKESYLAMERVCGLREDVPEDKINEPMTTEFDSPRGSAGLRVKGWVMDLPPLRAAEAETPA